MMATLSSRERRLIAVFILLAAMAGAWLLIVEPLATGFSNRAAERDRLAATFAADSRLIAAIPRMRRVAERQQTRAALFVMSATDQVAADEAIKERLSDAVTRAGGQLRSTDSVQTDMGWARAWAEARVTQRQLVALLSDLQNQPPYIVVPSLSITADPAEQAGQPDSLDVRIEAIVRHRPA